MLKQGKVGKLALWLSVMQKTQYSGTDTQGPETEQSSEHDPQLSGSLIRHNQYHRGVGKAGLLNKQCWGNRLSLWREN